MAWLPNVGPSRSLWLPEVRALSPHHRPFGNRPNRAWRISDQPRRCLHVSGPERNDAAHRIVGIPGNPAIVAPRFVNRRFAESEVAERVGCKLAVLRVTRRFSRFGSERAILWAARLSFLPAVVGSAPSYSLTAEVPERRATSLSSQIPLRTRASSASSRPSPSNPHPRWAPVIV